MKKNAHDTVPPPSAFERKLAKQWVEQQATEAIAQTLAEARWLSNLVHDRTKGNT